MTASMEFVVKTIWQPLIVATLNWSSLKMMNWQPRLATLVLNSVQCWTDGRLLTMFIMDMSLKIVLVYTKYSHSSATSGVTQTPTDQYFLASLRPIYSQVVWVMKKSLKSAPQNDNSSMYNALVKDLTNLQWP